MNKTLIRAAAVITLVAASITFFACSGEDGAAGASCKGTPSVTTAGAIDISCGGEYVGTLTQGNQGNPGQDGQGVPPTGCYLSASASGYNVICGGIDQGPLLTGGPGGGCIITTTPGSAYINFNCGVGNIVQLAKAICNYNDGTVDRQTAYDPDVELCSTGTGMDKGVKGNCDGEGYARAVQFCAKKTATATTREIFARCGATSDVETGEFIKEGVYNPITEFCSASVLPTAGKGTGNSPYYVQGNYNIAAGEIKALCGISPALGYQGSLDGRYSTNDFCASQDNTVYPLCGSQVFNPQTYFCLTANSSIAISVGAATTGVATLRCGTSGRNNDGKYYSDDDFCSSQTVYPLCKTLTASSSSITGTAVPDVSINATDGKYDVPNKYCRLKLTAKTDNTNFTVTASVEDLSVCGTRKYNPDREFCVTATQTVYPICESKGSTGTADNTTALSSPNSEVLGDYDVSKSFCDTRGVDIYKTVALLGAGTVNEIVKAKGGKLYSPVTIGTQVWTKQNVLVPTGTDTVPTSALANWSEAKEICPDGWKLPANADWDVLIATAGGENAALNLRIDVEQNATPNWVNAPTKANAVGFDAISPIATGTVQSVYQFSNPEIVYRDTITAATAADILAGNPGKGANAIFWSATEEVVTAGVLANRAYVKAIVDNDISVYSITLNKLATKINVRCIKN